MSETRSSHVPLIVRSVQRHVLLPAMLLASASVLLLSGCSSAFKTGLGSTEIAQVHVATVKGHVRGGQFPVQGSTVNVYAASTSGYGAASTVQTIGTAPVTNSSGDFSINFSCTTGQELYFVANGGDPLNDGGVSNNTALVLTAVMGPCDNYFTGISGFTNIDEVTTVATEYALAGFSTGYLNVGTSSTNTAGLANAFITATNLVNLETGQALNVTPQYPQPGTTNGTSTPPDVFSSIVPADTINSLANAVASCVNSVNSGVIQSTQCSNPSGPLYGLFDYTGGNQALASGNNVNNSPNPTTTAYPAGEFPNTADAVLYIAHNPGVPSVQGFSETPNVANILNLGGASPPFASPVLTTTPNDLTLTLNYVGGGMGGVATTSASNSSKLAIDSGNNIWVVNPARKTVSKFNNLGQPQTTNTTVNTTSPFGLNTAGGYVPGFTGANTAQNLAVDLSGNIWVADSSTNCLVGLSSAGASLGSFSALCPTTGAAGVAVDPSNNLWTAGGSFVFEATYSAGTANYTTGVAFSNPYTSGINTLTGYIQADEAGNVWFSDEGNGNFDSLPNSSDQVQTTLESPSAYAALGPYTGSDNVSGGLAGWITEPLSEGMQVLDVTGTPATESQPAPFLPTTFGAPTGVAIDGNGSVYIANTGGESGTGAAVTANLTVFTKGTTQASPYNTGYTGGSNIVFLDSPRGVAIDQSGNVWVVNNANHSANLSHSGQGVGPYAGDYEGSGTQASNLVEFVGLGAPTNPVLASAAKNGNPSFGGSPTAAGAYGVKP